MHDFFKSLDKTKLKATKELVLELTGAINNDNIEGYMSITHELISLGYKQFVPEGFEFSSYVFYKHTGLGICLKRSYWYYKANRLPNKLPTMFICNSDSKYWWVIQPYVKITKRSQKDAYALLCKEKTISSDIKYTNCCMWNNEPYYLDW